MNNFLAGHLSYHGLLCHKKFGDGDVVFLCVTPQKCGKKCQKRHFLQFFDAYILRDCEIQKFWLVMLQGHIRSPKILQQFLHIHLGIESQLQPFL